MGLRVVTLIVGVRALHQLGRSLGQDPYHGSHPVVGGSYMHPVGLYLGRWVLYPLPPLCGVVLLVRRGTWMVSDWTEVTAITSILVRLEQQNCSC
jgi:hypothetical protein